MPMNFPDIDSLIYAAEVHKFRLPKHGENEESYRLELHKHVLPIDRVEAFEIKFKVGWDQFDPAQKHEMLGLTPGIF